VARSEAEAVQLLSDVSTLVLTTDLP
jgi:hypothetical protein